MFKTAQSHVSLTSTDSDFYFSPNGISMVPRAHIEISDACPMHMQMVIHRAIADGYLKSVANLRDEEYTWELLRK